MSNILDKVKKNNEASNLEEALEEKTLNKKDNKAKKINASYTVDQINDINLRTYVLKEN